MPNHKARAKSPLAASRRAVGILFGVPLCMLFLIFSINIIVDPLQQFHANWFGLNWNQVRYTLPGIARRSKAAAVVTGASTSYYFGQEVEAIIGRSSLNLSLPGSTLKEQRLLLELALTAHPPQQVIWGVEWFSAGFDPEAVRMADFPYFLYGPRWQLVQRYLLDVTMAELSLHILAAKLGFIQAQDLIPQHQMENRWPTFKETGGNRVAAAYLSKKNYDAEAEIMKKNLPHDINAVARNLNYNIIDVINDHKETRFILFLPPHSIAAQLYLKKFFPKLWDVLVVTRRILIDRAGTYKNVQVFDFQTDADINSDLESYADLRHFSSVIGKQILEDIMSGKNQRVPGSAATSQAQLEQQIEAFEKNCSFCMTGQH